MLDVVLYAALVVAMIVTVLGSSGALLYATALVIPATQAMPEVLPPIGTPTNLIVLGLLIAALRAGGSPKKGHDPLPLRLALGLMALALIVGVAVRGLGQVSGISYLTPFADVVRNAWYWVTPFVVYWAAYRFIKSERTARRTILLCYVSMAAECAITFYESVRGYGRATAHLADPNAAGAYFSSAAAIFFTGMLWASGWRRWLYGVLWLMGVNAVFNSLSRGAMLSCVLASVLSLVIFYAFAPGRRVFKVGFLLALVFAVVNIAFLVPEKVHDRILVTFRGHAPSDVDNVDTADLDVSSEERLEYWSIAWTLSKEQPWGRGAFTFPQYCQANSVRDEAKQAHNIYLEVLVELGFQGLAAMLVLVVAVFRRLIKTFRTASDPFVRVTSVALMAWWTSHLAAHMFGNPFFLLQMIGQFFLMLAALFRLEKLGGAADREPSAASASARAGAVPLRA